MNPDSLTACSVCLRVLHGAEWIEAEHAIRELRSFELTKPPRLASAICPYCMDALRDRRAPLPVARAA
jgi:hypothetical protein